MGHVSLVLPWDWIKQLLHGSSHAKQASAQFILQFFNRLQVVTSLFTAIRSRFGYSSNLVPTAVLCREERKRQKEKWCREYEKLDAVLIYELYVYSTWIQKSPSSLLASVIPASSVVAFFPINLCAPGIWWLGHPLSWQQLQDSSYWGSTQSFAFLCSPCFEDAETEDSEKASSRVSLNSEVHEAWGRQCP